MHQLLLERFRLCVPYYAPVGASVTQILLPFSCRKLEAFTEPSLPSCYAIEKSLPLSLSGSDDYNWAAMAA